MEPSRIDFGSRFKQEREARHLSLGDVARVTKIPERSLERLEGGRFDELPAEVFVRGFVRSYARAVGLDPDDMARLYGELVQTGEPRTEPSLAGAVKAVAARAVTVTKPETAPAVGASTHERARTVAPIVAAAPPVVAIADEPAVTVADTFVDEGIVVVHRAARPAKKDPSQSDEMRTLSQAILDAGRETRRLPLTLAVIILVIVATLTMSLLLNRPNHIGDGLTQRSVAEGARTSG